MIQEVVTDNETHKCGDCGGIIQPFEKYYLRHEQFNFYHEPVWTEVHFECPPGEDG